MKRTRSEVSASLRNHQIPKWQDAVAGAFAGASSKTAMAPLERVKLLLQLQGSVNGISGRSPWEVATHVYRKEGILAFWRGNLPNVLRTGGQAALNFSLMDYYKSLALSPFVEKAVIQQRQVTTQEFQRRRQLVVSFVSGGLAGATSTTTLYPIEFLRTRLAMNQGRSSREFRGMRDVIVKTVHADGLLGLYQGYGVALGGSVLYRILFLGGYDALKSELHHWKNDEDSVITFSERFAIAQTVSLTAGTICYPIDSVRRRLMMQAGKPMGQRLYTGSMDCIHAIWAKEGMRGFYLGLTPNLVRSIGGAVMLVAYDAFKTVL